MTFLLFTFAIHLIVGMTCAVVRIKLKMMAIYVTGVEKKTKRKIMAKYTQFV